MNADGSDVTRLSLRRQMRDPFESTLPFKQYATYFCWLNGSTQILLMIKVSANVAEDDLEGCELLVAPQALSLQHCLPATLPSYLRCVLRIPTNFLLPTILKSSDRSMMLKRIIVASRVSTTHLPCYLIHRWMSTSSVFDAG